MMIAYDASKAPTQSTFLHYMELQYVPIALKQGANITSLHYQIKFWTPRARALSAELLFSCALKARHRDHASFNPNSSVIPFFSCGLNSSQAVRWKQDTSITSPHTQVRMWSWTYSCSLEVRCYNNIFWYPNSNLNCRELVLSVYCLLFVTSNPLRWRLFTTKF